MTAATPSGADQKFQRSRHHLADLTRGVRTYLDSEPFQTYTEGEPESGPLIYRVRIRADPPPELGLILGDAIHNARSALDHVACALVLAGGGTVNGQTMFPAAKSRSSWAEMVRNRLKGATPSATAAVESLNVYPGGDDQLHALHRLDIEDKHKILIPVGMSMRTFNLHYGIDGQMIDAIGIRPEDPMFQIADGMEIFRIEEQPRFDTDARFDFDYSFTFELGLGGPAMADGRPVPLLESVTAWVDHAEAVAAKLAGEL